MDCHICLDKKPNLRILPCSHELCLKCYVRLNKPACPFCRVSFTYTADDIKYRAKIGLINGYQSTDVQPGMILPDEFVFGSSTSILENLYNTENLNMRSRSYSDSIILSATRFEESGATRSSKKNKRYDYKNNSHTNRKSIEEINERRYLVTKRELKKWERKEGRLNKILNSIGGSYEL
jgi:hypothetical protein